MVSVGDYDGRTALHVAAGEGNVGAVRILVSAGADVAARDRFGGTPWTDAQRWAGCGAPVVFGTRSGASGVCSGGGGSGSDRETEKILSELKELLGAGVQL